MLDASAELFRAQGYHATGLTQIMEAGKAPKGSLYFHFPGGKEQLAAEAMTEAADRVSEGLIAAAGVAPDAAGAIAIVMDALTAELESSGFRGGCPIATVALDAGGGSELIGAACRHGFDSWRDAVITALIRDGADQERARDLATIVLASIEGALLLARTHRDITPMRVVRDHLVTILTKEFS
jgi:TetR/AcrR family transcriptional repressor of lmrAB and yxaGH operons